MSSACYNLGQASCFCWESPLDITESVLLFQPVSQESRESGILQGVNEDPSARRREEACEIIPANISKSMELLLSATHLPLRITFNPADHPSTDEKIKTFKSCRSSLKSDKGLKAR